MELSWQPEVDDYVDGLTRAHRLSRNKPFTLPRPIRVVLAVLVLLGLFRAFAGDGRDAMIIAILIGYLAILIILNRRAGRRLADPDRMRAVATRLWLKHETLRAPSRAELSADGLRITSGPKSTFYPWSSVRSVSETERSVLIGVHARPSEGVNLTSKIVFAVRRVVAQVVLPKRALAQPDQLAELRALLIEAVPQFFPPTPPAPATSSPTADRTRSPRDPSA